MEAKHQKSDGENSDGYTTETDTLTEGSVLQAKNQLDSQESTASFNSWAFSIKDSHHVKKFYEDDT